MMDEGKEVWKRVAELELEQHRILEDQRKLRAIIDAIKRDYPTVLAVVLFKMGIKE